MDKGRLLIKTSLILLCMCAQVSGEQYALLVGVKKYRRTELTSLKYTEKDVTDIANTLISKGYKKDNVVLMTQSADDVFLQPTSQNIREQIELLLSGLTPEDNVMFAFTGHGVQFKGEGQHYFCPSDARIKDKRTLISLAKVFESLEQCKASGKVLLVDACRDDPLTGLAKSSGRIELGTISNQVPSKLQGGTIAFFSCAQAQQSWEDPKLGHGVFFYHVNQALAGAADLRKDGSITFNELATYVTPATKDYVRVELGSVQVPTFRSPGDSQEIVLIVGSGPKKTVFNGMGMKLRLIPSGQFMMGSGPSEPNHSKNELLHPVEISKAFYLGATEVTQRQWTIVMKSTPWVKNAGDQDMASAVHPQKPANYVSWHDANEFCKRLGELEKRSYRLPTEAEWEYACRADTSGSSTFCFGDDVAQLVQHAWFIDDENEDFRDKFAEQVAMKKPNELGLYDMHGNVFEWCSDWMDHRYYRNSPKPDPTGPKKGKSRVIRGGSFAVPADLCRSACRYESSPDNRWSEIGFRVVMEVDSPKKAIAKSDNEARR